MRELASSLYASSDDAVDHFGYVFVDLFFGCGLLVDVDLAELHAHYYRTQENSV